MKISISVTNKNAKADDPPSIVCGNSDYTIAFNFDSEWADYTVKTARFSYIVCGQLKRYIDVVFSGDECSVPVFHNIDAVEVGVYAGDLRTSTPAIIPCKKSILCDGGAPDAPSEDVYNQIMEQLATVKPPDINIENSEGAGSLQQELDAVSWAPDASQTDVLSDTAIYKDGDAILTGAFGDFSAMMGGKSQAKGKRAFAEGTSTIALGNYSHAEGNKTFAKAVNSHAEGLLTNALGGNSHAEGASTRATGDNSHAEGHLSEASGYGSHAEGNQTTASGEAAHTEGSSNAATGNCAHAEGAGNTASGYASHAEGDSNKAIGSGSHAGGVMSQAKHNMSFVHGTYLETGRVGQSVFGEYNAVDANALFAVGNGTSQTNRKNAFQVNADGTMYAGGKQLGITFIAKFGVTTLDEILAAVNDGRACFCVIPDGNYKGTVLPLTSYSTAFCSFSTLYNPFTPNSIGNAYEMTVWCHSGGWTSVKTKSLAYV